MSDDKITVSATIQAPIHKVWAYWNAPEHIRQWNQASADWHCPQAENDLRADGKFSSRMEAKDGSVGFDFSGIYDEVKEHETIRYTIGDGRKVVVLFAANGNQTRITEIFEAENQNSADMQRAGWQAILNSFKAYAEGNI